MNNYKKRGFTLFELLVSISIIGILTAIASVSFSSAQKKARDARRMEDMASIAKAAESFYAVNSATYPANVPSSGSEWVATGIGDTILANFPSDPKPSPYVQYRYQVDVPTPGGFCVCAYMENTNNANATNNSCDFGSGGDYYCVRNQQ